MKTLFLLATLLMAISSRAQHNEDKFFVFDKDWKATAMNTAAYLIRVSKTPDHKFQHLTYNIFGPRISKETFSDEAGKVPDGPCIYYQKNGTYDSVGSFTNGVLTGSWNFWNAEGRMFRQKDYDNGIIIKDSLYPPPPKDVPASSIAAPGEEESSFRGGQAGWVKFLTSNLDYPKRAYDANVTGSVRLQFMVDENGILKDPEINKSVEYSLDEEALRIIRKSPKWLPASKDGVKVKSYKLQPIGFKFTR